VPARYIDSSALVGTTLHVTGFDSTTASGRDLYAVDLGTKQVQKLVTANVLSPVRASGNTVLWAEFNGLRRLTAGATTPATISGTTGQCTDLLVAGQFIYCSIGGSARFGVSDFGIQRIPVSGGAMTWVKESLNRARLAFVAPYLFHVGTTDNFSSFANLGAVDATDGMDQVFASGGTLQSDFVMADAQALYFVETGSTSRLTRAPFDSTSSSVIVTGGWLDRDLTVLRGGDVFTVTKVGTTTGLWKISTTTPTDRALVLSDADLRANDSVRPEALHPNGNGWLFITESVVYRTLAAAQ